MKKIEQFLVGLITFLFLGVLIVGDEFTTVLFISTFILSLVYIFGGFYVLSHQNDKNYINILAGIILGSALGVFAFSLSLPISIFKKVLVSINIIFAITLIGLWIYKKSDFKKQLKYILYRSVVIAILTSFFTFSSIHFYLYRNILLRMVTPDSNLHYNFLMFEKISEYKNSMTLKNYDQAIIEAKDAIEYGKKWKDYDIAYYQDFSGAYEFLANAYIENGDKHYNANNFVTALSNYKKADSILAHKEHQPHYVKSNKRDIYWNHYNLLLVYDKLDDYDNYDAEFDFLVDHYLTVKDSIDIDYHHILKSASKNYYHRAFYEDAIAFNKYSLDILKQDSITNVESLKSTYIRLVKNYLITDSTQSAKRYIKQYKNNSSENDCVYLFYTSKILQKENIQEALKFAKRTCDCFEQENKASNLFFATVIRLELELENSDFQNFESQIVIAKNLLSTTNNKLENQSYIDQLLGNYNFLKGNYILSKKYFTKAINYCKNHNEIRKNILELKLAQVNDDLDINYDRDTLNSNILNFLSEYDTTFPSSTIFHNDLGNINIGFNSKLSDSIFNVTIATHKSFDIQTSNKLGVAYNGLATNQLYRENYKKADSLYTIAIKKLDDYYDSQQHINQLICYLNIIESKINQEKYDEAFTFLTKAKLTKSNCFDKDVTIYDAYLLNLEGDILKEGKKNNSESIKYYKEALDIARNYFNDNHKFIRNLKNKTI